MNIAAPVRVGLHVVDHGMRTLALLLTFSALTATASAQDPSPDQAIAQVSAVADRIAAELACVRARHADLIRTVDLMREAQAQMARSQSGSRAHQDARDAIRSLSQRAIEIERAAIACRSEPSAAAASGAPIGGVITRREPLTGSAAAVAQPNAATRVVERDAVLSPNVKAIVGEQVDGEGTVDAGVVRASVRGVASRLSRCYDRLVERGALARGTVILVFTIEPSGRVTEIRTEQNRLGNNAFAQCLRTAARHMHSSRGAAGGDATFSYTLQFPAD